jgi:tRNA dimethylallyltransferase
LADASLRVICGPTAAGKSALALALAERVGAVIVSADSRQIYRGFDLGTAKPSAAERARVSHVGIDVAEPTVRYSASSWADAAVTWIAEARGTGRSPLIVGGTGFYLRALFSPLFGEPPLDQARRCAIQRELAARSTDELRRWCEALDPRRAGLGRAQLLRALEVALLTGRRLSDLHAAGAHPARFRARYLVVDPGPALAGRIARRVDAMLEGGWGDEVEQLARTVPEDAPAWNAAGYDTIRRQVRGEVRADAARERVIVETRQYAKRQRTWFRHQLPATGVTRVDPADPRCGEIVQLWWDEEEPA